LLINPKREGEGAWRGLRVRYLNGCDVAAKLPIDGHGGEDCYSCDFVYTADATREADAMDDFPSHSCWMGHFAKNLDLKISFHTGPLVRLNIK
jgi:hypothetical protein